ncbi:MAG TPA: NAD-dependent epimerase/dehydratase family protein [Candidatus Limnocylindria bacterium]
MSVRLLVLGAGGFIGRHVAAAARSAPGVDLVVHGRELLDLDAATDDELAELLRTTAPDAIVNAVGAIGGPVELMRRLNAALPERLGHAVLAASPHARLVHLGSAAEYGHGERGVATSEDWPPRPVSPYGETKLAGTGAVLALAERGLDGVVLRVFNPIGAGLPETAVLGRAAAEMRRAIAADEDRIRLGPLGAYRDFVDVADVADAVLAVTRPARITARLLNVGSGQATRVRAAVRGLAEVAGFGGAIEESSRPPDRSSEVDWQRADVRRVASVAGWRPTRPLQGALRDLWRSTAASGD